MLSHCFQFQLTKSLEFYFYSQMRIILVNWAVNQFLCELCISSKFIYIEYACMLMRQIENSCAWVVLSM